MTPRIGLAGVPEGKSDSMFVIGLLQIDAPTGDATTDTGRFRTLLLA